MLPQVIITQHCSSPQHLLYFSTFFTSLFCFYNPHLFGSELKEYYKDLFSRPHTHPFNKYYFSFMFFHIFVSSWYFNGYIKLKTIALKTI